MAKCRKLALIVLFIPLCLFGQAETGHVTGTISDPSGASIPNALLKIRDLANGSERTGAANLSGVYSVTNLEPGEYLITVTHEGFSTARQKFTLSVGQKLGLDFKLPLGNTSTTVEVAETAPALQVNTETQTLAQVVGTRAMTELPSLTRNPYDFVMTAGMLSEDDPAGRGAGVAINGLRSASTNILLDGVANNDEFVASVGQSVPLDSVQEMGIITSNFTAEYGRAAGGVVNVTTRSGSNSFHGTAYEFNRVDALASTGFGNNAFGVAKSPFVRNQFGYSLGGPIKKNKLFFFNNTEWTRVRSTANLQVLVLDPALVAASSAATQSVYTAYGTLAPGATVLQTLTRPQLTALGANPCLGGSIRGGCNTYGSTKPMMDLVNYTVPADAGAGAPQNSYQTVGRVDYNFSDRTQLYVRYALQSELDFEGTVSNSPYQGFNTGDNVFNNSLLVSLTRTFSPRLVSQSKLDFNRFNGNQPLSSAGVSPTYFLSTGSASVGPYAVVMPGYFPVSAGSSIPFGGPQNFGQAYQDFSFSKGKHQMRWGGSFDYIRDNRTFGAFETSQQDLGNKIGSGIDNLVAGQLYQFEAAVNPQGKYPCVNGVQTPACTVTLPIGQPNFSRSNRYREGAVYFQDSWKVAPRITVNLGLRWEYFGVQHNVNPSLDSNFYPASNTSQYQAIAQGQVMPAPQSPIGELWQPSKHNFAPRVGFAWDIFGDGKTSLRGGYGIGYERNFGNVTYNVLFNPPNYAVVDLIAGSNVANIAINAANFGPLSASSGSAALPQSELRFVQPNIPQAYAHLISAALERQITSTMRLEIDYSASIGVNQYDIADVNVPGMGNYYLNVPCTPDNTLSFGTGACEATLNNQYAAINRRGAGGRSNYNAMNVRYDIFDVKKLGLSMRMNYTWSHSNDDLSDTFSSSGNQFNLGNTDPFNPSVDYGSSNFDNRQRIAISGIWEVPFARNIHGVAGYFLDGWELAPVFTARTGAPYTIYDITNDNYIYTRVAVNGAIDPNGNVPRVSNGSDSFAIFDFSKIATDETWVNPKTGDADFGPWPGNFTGRDAFRTPGTWNLDLGAYKNTKLTEKTTLQLRLEAYNAFNHSNFAINTGSAYISNGTGLVTGSYYGNRNVQLAAKLIF